MNAVSLALWDGPGLGVGDMGWQVGQHTPLSAIRAAKYVEYILE
jgi:hypothetical protein